VNVAHAPHIFDAIELILGISLMLIILCHCVPEKKYFLMVSIDQHQQDFYVVVFGNKDWDLCTTTIFGTFP